MDQELTEVMARLSRAEGVDDSDVRALRALIWDEDGVDASLIDALFALNDRIDKPTEAWVDCFVEAAGYFLIEQVEPRGFVDEANAAWLQTRIDRQGRLVKLAELELMVAVCEHAQSVPDTLRNFVLDQIEKTVLSGEGPTRNSGLFRPKCVDDEEVTLLRRLVFAAGGEGATVVGSREADMLFRIKDATLGGDNASTWLQLFVQAVGNHLLEHSDYRPLTRDEAIRLNAEMDSNTPNVAGFFRRMIPQERIGTGTIIEAFKLIFPGRPDPLDENVHQAISRGLSLDEASWLKAHIVADGEIDAYEKALLTFLVDEVGCLPSMLENLRMRA